ncbi:PaaX family transcriptional regulator C-terminal domain-containing protein [Aurantimonas sp. VKM B-3413]|uniref:PaaX family transcriptional regulator n=1 Tax=Aurantimonas sp. VKM B-3413 TaxID=2779401 RepID=UPI001E361BAA|nr:PaaX family transcriptional regulator C-terminal domain-containing protein [Aurantimonas sp. VKM B-3413]MCB8836378.1 PaaX family transcriptional regulator [Aurantimonas sp. VKM B-3413]
MPEASGVIDTILDTFPVRAGAFIVTLYGDVVAPRGGEVWMGNIIDTCATMRITETRVRTAVSRLVAADQIMGERVGRKSYYRLTPAAEAAFSSAARLIYRRPRSRPLKGWHLVALPQGPERDALVSRLTALRFGLPQPHLAILPDRGEDLPPLGAPHFQAVTTDDLTVLLRNAWPLAEISARIGQFVEGFSPLAGRRTTPAEALGLRLLLVHTFRQIALTDPDLPEDLLPEDWRGAEARALFAHLYLELSPAADMAIADGFVNSSGPLTADPTRLARRIADLSYA